MPEHAHTVEPTLARLTRGLEEADGLDPAVGTLERVADGLLADDRVRHLLHGRPLGHAAHPLLTDLPLGFWFSSLTLDLLGGRDAHGAADRLLGLGILSTAPAVVTGIADWATGDRPARRVGAVHAACNSVALAGFGASWLLRRAGHRTAGVVASLAASAAAGAGGYLGGHLAFQNQTPRREAANPAAA